MTSEELKSHFKEIGINNKLLESWNNLSNKLDMAKYAKYVPPVDEYHRDKLNLISMIKLFNQVSVIS